MMPFSIIVLAHRGAGPTNRYASVYKKKLPARTEPYYNGHILPENSLSAIEHALKHGADGFEVDVINSADGVPMVIHDLELARNVDGYHYWDDEQQQNILGNVSDYTCEELQKNFTIGNNERIPTLDEVIQLTLKYNNQYRAQHGHNIIINVEFKEDPDVAESTYSLIKQYIDDPECPLIAEDFLFNSFDIEPLRRIKAFDSRMRTSLGTVTKTLFGEITKPGWLPLKKDYQDSAMRTLTGYTQSLKLDGLDFITSDIEDELMQLCNNNNTFITATTNEIRLRIEAKRKNSIEQYWSEFEREKKEVRRILALAKKNDITIYYKANTPGHMRQYLEKLKNILHFVDEVKKQLEKCDAVYDKSKQRLFSSAAKHLREYAVDADNKEDDIGRELANMYANTLQRYRHN